MIITYSAKIGLFAATTLRRCWLLVLLVGSLGACQRASYQFQSIAGASYLVIEPVPVSESAVVAIAAQPGARSGKSLRHSWHRAHRPVRLPQLLRVQAPALSVLPAARAAARATIEAPRQRQEPGPVTKPVRYRSRTIAIILAVLAITYLPLSLHNFYLGYYGRGAAAIALVIVGIYLVVLGSIGSLFSGTAIVGVGLVGLAMLGGWLIWQLSDLIRIITRDLKPKNGEYNRRITSTNPDSGTTPR